MALNKIKSTSTKPNKGSTVTIDKRPATDHNTSSVNRPVKTRPVIETSTDCDDEIDTVMYEKTEPTLNDDVMYTGVVEYSNKENGRYKLVIQLEDDQIKTFTEPYPFKVEYSAVARLFRENGWTRLSDLEGFGVAFSIYDQKAKKGNKTFQNIYDIVLWDGEDENENAPVDVAGQDGTEEVVEE